MAGSCVGVAARLCAQHGVHLSKPAADALDPDLLERLGRCRSSSRAQILRASWRVLLPGSCVKYFVLCACATRLFVRPVAAAATVAVVRSSFASELTPGATVRVRGEQGVRSRSSVGSAARWPRST